MTFRDFDIDTVRKVLARAWGSTMPVEFEHPSYSGHWSQVKCPGGCEYSLLHPALGRMIIWPDFDDYDAPSGSRGEFILIPLWCEQCSEEFALEIGNHKGKLFMKMMTRMTGDGQEAVRPAMRGDIDLIQQEAE